MPALRCADLAVLESYPCRRGDRVTSRLPRCMSLLLALLGPREMSDFLSARQGNAKVGFALERRCDASVDEEGEIQGERSCVSRPWRSRSPRRLHCPPWRRRNPDCHRSLTLERTM